MGINFLSIKMEPVKDQLRTPCADCGCAVGTEHELGCDIERCPECGGQLVSCGHFRITDEDGDTYYNHIQLHTRGREKWSGIMYEAERLQCEAQGWYCYWLPNPNGPELWHGGQWVPCDATHPNAMHDINRACLERKKWI